MRAGARLGAVVLLFALAACTGPPPAGRPPAARSPQRSTGVTRQSDGRSDPVPDALYPAHGHPDLDVLHYGLALTWTPEHRQLSGSATLTIRVVRATARLTLDFGHWYTIDGATVDGRPVTPHPATSDVLSLDPGRTLPADTRTSVVVRYHGTPHPVPEPSSRADADEGLGLRAEADGSLWTMQEPYGAYTWYPVSELPSDKALYDIAVTVPAGWSAVASGEYVGRIHDTYTWHGSDPQASYLVTLAVGHYTELALTGPHGIPVTVWYRTGRDAAQLPALRQVPALLSWLEARFGRYPFPSAGAVVVPSTSAMETQEMITLGDDIGDTAEVTVALLHELAHQWFGDAVTPATFRDLWLNEGFATYAQQLYAADRGYEPLATWRSRALADDGRLRQRYGPPGHPRADQFAQSNVYICPALMLDTIRRRVGDTAFAALLRDWVGDHRYGVVDRATFVAYANRHTGVDLTNTINTWLDSTGTPR